MADIIKKEYVKVPDGRTMKVSLFYDLGGINYFSGRTNPRGYVLSVTPVEVSDVGGFSMESFTLGSGIGHTLIECNRRSKKLEAQAIAMIDTPYQIDGVTWKQRLIDHVVNSNSVFDRQSKEKVNGTQPNRQTVESTS